MASVYWTGNGTAVAQVTTVEITAYDAATTYILTVGDLTVSVVGDTDTATTATNLKTAWNNATHSYFTAVTASDASSVITLTADTAGVPFTVASSVSGGTGTIGSATTTTAATSAYHWDNGDNWDGGAAPSSSDDCYITKSGAKVLWGLDQSATTFSSLTVRQDVTIGLPVDSFTTSADGLTTTTAASEYRDTYLKLKASTVDIGEHIGPGTATAPSRCKIDNSITTASVTTIYNTSSTTADTNKPAVRLLFADADADVFVRAAPGGVGIAADAPNETTTVGDVYMYDASVAGDLFLGAGVTVTRIYQKSGDSRINAAATITLVEIEDGIMTTEGDYTITTMNVNGGEVRCNHIKTGGSCVTTLNQYDGTVSFFDNSEPRTITTYNRSGGRREIDEYITITTDNVDGRVVESIA